MGADHGDARIAAHPLVGGQQDAELFLGRHLEGVVFAGAVVAPARRRLGGELGRGRSRLCLGDLERALECALEPGAGELPRGREAPGSAAAHANPDALALVALDLVDLSVARGERLRARAHVARVGVVAAVGGRLGEVGEKVAHRLGRQPRADPDGKVFRSVR